MHPIDSKERFSNRVADYVKYRPDYPRQILVMLREKIGLSPGWRIADIGSGTGISTGMFLENGNEVFAVEPNAKMRQAAEEWLGENPKFHSIDASAELTTLPGTCIDLIVCAQAFHWFDLGKCKIEFLRILKPGGWCALIWNERKTAGSRFLEEYEDLLSRYSGDYMAVRHDRLSTGKLEQFFAPHGFELQTFSNQQLLDLEGLVGRCVSSSYAPAAGDPKYEPMVAELKEIFQRNQVGGRINFEYVTNLYLGKLGR